MIMLSVSIGVMAQDKPALENTAELMVTNTVAGNFESVANGTYPKIFEVMPKEKMMEGLKQMLNGDGFSILLLKTDPKFEYGPIKKVDDGWYCLVKHDMLMKMTFKDPVNDADSKTMIQNLKTAMQTNDISFEAKSNSFIIKKRVDVIFANDKLTNKKWKYLNKSSNNLMAKMFEPEVLKALGI